MREYIKFFCEKQSFGEYTEGVLKIFDELQSDKRAYDEFCGYLKEFDFNEKPDEVKDGEFFKKLKEASKSSPVHEYSYCFLYFVCLSKDLLEEYRKRGIDEEIFYATTRDLYSKLIECIDNRGIYGTFVGSWYFLVFKFNVFAFGRLQFQPGKYRGESCEIGGETVTTDTDVLYIHIPSYKEPFDRAARRDAYKKAYEFFKNEFGTEYIKFACCSWLMFPETVKAVSKTSNIGDFCNEFKYIYTDISPTYGSIWRIFGRSTENFDGENYEVLDEKTSIQKQYKELIKNKKPVGRGYGIFMYNGETIINQ